jgi:hypothetical protein
MAGIHVVVRGDAYLSDALHRVDYFKPE